jgi:hypothetical protein
LIHSGEIIIIGVYSSCEGLTVVWHHKDEPVPFPEEDCLVKDNPLVITLGEKE